jgi:hypothetical protein
LSGVYQSEEKQDGIDDKAEIVVKADDGDG